MSAIRSQYSAVLHEVRRDDDGDALFHEAVDVGPKLAPGDWVDAGGGLVQKERLGLVHDGAREREPLLIAERQLFGRHAQPIAEGEDVDHLIDLPVLRGPGQSVDPGEEAQILIDAQVAVERELLRHVTQPVPCACRVLAEIFIPATRPSPSFGLSRPQSMRNVVDLPAPLGPSNPKISPGGTSNAPKPQNPKTPKPQTLLY